MLSKTITQLVYANVKNKEYLDSLPYVFKITILFSKLKTFVGSCKTAKDKAIMSNNST